MSSVIVISGPSAGVGKGTIIKELLKRDPNLYLARSVTTRPKRAYETDGVEYYFRSEEEFNDLIKRGELVEWMDLLGYRYGTLRREISKPLKRGKDVILEVDIRGARRIREKNLTNTVFIFIRPPSFEYLVKRIKKRGTESDIEQEKRLQIAKSEMTTNYYDFDVVNEEGKVLETVQEIENIIEKARQKG